MNILNVLDAKEAITKLNKVKFNDFKIVSKVYKLTKDINNILEMVQQEQNKIVKKYAKFENDKPSISNGQYQFDSIENRNNFIKEMEELKKSNIDNIEKIDIPVDSIQYMSELTSVDMMILEPFINWIF